MNPALETRQELLLQTAWAKVNLSLRVLGRRPDGYHELESLVIFAGVGDMLTLDTARPLGLDVIGPEAAGLAPVAGPASMNLVLKAAEAVLAYDPELRLGHFRLQKHLPVAAGLGGGSADAAAVLGLAALANPERSLGIDWMAIAASIGADVPVCLGGRSALMTGRGEHVAPLTAMPDAALVLANPRLALSTASVFQALGARPMTMAAPARLPPELQNLNDVLGYLAQRPNDLEPAAIRLCPAIGRVRDALARLDGALMVRMSGSGATCFALFADMQVAQVAAITLAAAEPGWWVRAAEVL